MKFFFFVCPSPCLCGKTIFKWLISYHLLNSKSKVFIFISSKVYWMQMSHLMTLQPWPLTHLWNFEIQRINFELYDKGYTCTRYLMGILVTTLCGKTFKMVSWIQYGLKLGNLSIELINTSFQSNATVPDFDPFFKIFNTAFKLKKTKTQ